MSFECVLSLGGVLGALVNGDVYELVWEQLYALVPGILVDQALKVENS